MEQQRDIVSVGSSSNSNRAERLLLWQLASIAAGSVCRTRPLTTKGSCPIANAIIKILMSGPHSKQVQSDG